MVVFCISDALTSVAVGYASSKFGRNLPMAIAFCLDIGQYMFMLNWTPTVDTTYYVYFSAVLYGIIDGTLQLITQGLYTVLCFYLHPGFLSSLCLSR